MESRSALDIFQENLNAVKKEADDYLNAWKRDAGVLVNQCPVLKEEMQERESSLRTGRNTMKEALAKPVIRIATAGTTSSAKSTLLNFLCGEELLPTDVQEKSAGTVYITHADTPALTMENTKGALWPCGTIPVSSAQEIHDVLNKAMDAYRACVEQGKQDEIDPPVVRVRYPLRLYKRLELPEGIKFDLELMDLPGLRFCGDENNRKVIDNCKNALCLLTYNSAETDPNKQEELLAQVVDQVRKIGGPIKRMLFVATKIDEFFLKEEAHWPANEDDFVEKCCKTIQEKLCKEFPEQEKDLETLDMARLSPMPALHMVRLEKEDESCREHAWKQIKRSFLGLVLGGRDKDPQKGVDTDEFGKKFQLWGAEEWNQVYDQLGDTTHAFEFEDRLIQHIGQNLSALILPAACMDFCDAAEEAEQWLRQNAESRRVQIDGEYEAQKKRLDDLRCQLRKINDEGKNLLTPFLDAFQHVQKGSGINDMGSRRAIEELAQKLPSVQKQELRPLASDSWGHNIINVCPAAPVDAVNDRILEIKAIPERIPYAADLEKICRKLGDLGYRGDRARNNSPIRACRDKQTIKVVEEMQKNFNSLSEQLSNSIYENMKLTCCSEAGRIYDAITLLKDAYLRYLKEKYKENLPENAQKIGDFAPLSLKRGEMGSISKKAPVTIKNEIQKRKVTEEEVRSNIYHGKYEIINDLVNLWRSIWGTDTVKVKVQKDELNGKIYSIRNFTKEVRHSILQAHQGEIVDSFTSYIQNSLTNFTDQITAYQDKLLENYQKRLEKICQEQCDILQNSKEEIIALQEDIEKFSGHISTLQGYYHG